MKTEVVAVQASAEPAVGFLRALALPLLLRAKLGEGVLLLVNVGLLVATKTPPATFALRAFVSLAALALMYALNDFWDAAADRENPRKNRELAEFFLVHRGRFKLVLLGLHAALVLLALVGGGPALALPTITALGLNALYSTYLKGVRVVDVIVVGAWGAACAAIAAPTTATLVVGAMTAASHVFQTLGDVDADRRAGVFTSAARPLVPHLLLFVASAAMVAGFFLSLGAFASFGALPFVFGLAVRSSYRAWLLSKLAFGALFLAFLVRLHAGV